MEPTLPGGSIPIYRETTDSTRVQGLLTVRRPRRDANGQ